MKGVGMAGVDSWTIEDVKEWLQENGFSSYISLLCVQHRIDGAALLLLCEDDLSAPPCEIKVLGDRKRLMFHIHKLRSGSNRLQSHSLLCNYGQKFPNEPLPPRRLDSECSGLSEESNDIELLNGKEGKRSQRLEPEYRKLVIAYVYMFSAFLLTSFVMVIVHDRVPDTKKYPPLPDIVLDNMPYVPWAFEMCEFTGLILLIVWTIILFFHKHRFILLRRMFSMAGTVFLLRCVTMLITSLSVPGIHLKCEPKTPGDIWSQIERALKIWQGCGMSLRGVRTCGDYMFSGHTVVVTLLNFFITEYTPRSMYWLHTTTWILNIFGVFFILAAHEHYSIDVFVAFYITSRLFLYYHSLANNRALMQQDHRRTRIWFPMFSYFESKCNGIVPNEFEWPFPYPASFKKYFEKQNKINLQKWQ